MSNKISNQLLNLKTHTQKKPFQAKLVVFGRNRWNNLKLFNFEIAIPKRFFYPLLSNRHTFLRAGLFFFFFIISNFYKFYWRKKSDEEIESNWAIDGGAQRLL